MISGATWRRVELFPMIYQHEWMRSWSAHRRTSDAPENQICGALPAWNSPHVQYATSAHPSKRRRSVPQRIPRYTPKRSLVLSHRLGRERRQSPPYVAGRSSLQCVWHPEWRQSKIDGLCVRQVGRVRIAFRINGDRGDAGRYGLNPRRRLRA